MFPADLRQQSRAGTTGGAPGVRRARVCVGCIACVGSEERMQQAMLVWTPSEVVRVDMLQLSMHRARLELSLEFHHVGHQVFKVVGCI